MLSDVGGNRAVAVSAGDSDVVLRMCMEADEGFSHTCNRFVVFAVVEAMPLVGESSGSAASLGGMS